MSSVFFLFLKCYNLMPPPKNIINIFLLKQYSYINIIGGGMMKRTVIIKYILFKLRSANLDKLRIIKAFVDEVLQ